MWFWWRSDMFFKHVRCCLSSVYKVAQSLFASRYFDNANALYRDVKVYMKPLAREVTACASTNNLVMSRYAQWLCTNYTH